MEAETEKRIVSLQRVSRRNLMRVLRLFRERSDLFSEAVLCSPRLQSFDTALGAVLDRFETFKGRGKK